MVHTGFKSVDKVLLQVKDDELVPLIFAKLPAFSSKAADGINFSSNTMVFII